MLYSYMYMFYTLATVPNLLPVWGTRWSWPSLQVWWRLPLMPAGAKQLRTSMPVLWGPGKVGLQALQGPSQHQNPERLAWHMQRLVNSKVFTGSTIRGLPGAQQQLIENRKTGQTGRTRWCCPFGPLALFLWEILQAAPGKNQIMFNPFHLWLWLACLYGGEFLTGESVKNRWKWFTVFTCEIPFQIY